MRMARFGMALLVGLVSGCGGNLSSPDFFPKLVGVVIEDVTPTQFDALGQTRQYRALGQYSTPPGSDAAFTSRPVTAEGWESSEATIAGISNAGVATALRNGTTDIRARFGGLTSAPLALTVAAPLLQAITLTPAAASVPLGLTQALTATGTYRNADGSTRQQSVVEPLSWVSAEPGIAAVTPTANPATVSTLLQRVEPVAIRVSAVSADGSLVEAASAITVIAPELVQLVVVHPPAISTAPNLSPPFAVPRGATINLQALGIYTDNPTPRAIPGAVSWASADTGATVISVLTQSNGTLNVTGVAIGASAVIATAAKNDGLGSVSSEPATINVGAAVLQSLDGARITPSPARVAVGASLQLAVIGRFSDGSEAMVPAASLNWTSSLTGIATVNASGVATGRVQGATVITATLRQTPATGAGSVSTTLTVTDGVCTGPLLQSEGASVATATTPVLCLACTVVDEALAIDNSVATFASINTTLGLLFGSASLTAASATEVPFAATGQRAGFIISRPPGELLSLALLGNVTVNTLDASDAVLDSATSQDGLRLTLLGNYVLGQDAFLLSLPVTQPFRKLQVVQSAGVATAIESLRVNAACGVAAQ